MDVASDMLDLFSNYDFHSYIFNLHDTDVHCAKMEEKLVLVTIFFFCVCVCVSLRALRFTEHVSSISTHVFVMLIIFSLIFVLCEECGNFSEMN